MLTHHHLARGLPSDTRDDLESEIRGKIKIGYDLRNTIFEDTRRAVLYQNGQVALEADLRQPLQLAALLTRFFSHTDEHIEEFGRAVARFREDIPTLAGGLKKIIDDARRDNPKFTRAFDDFHALCKSALNPAIRADVIEEMLVQHLLTERLFRTVLGNSEFAQRNVIAGEIEKVIAALTSRSFSRAEFLKALDYFYVAIETEAQTITTYAEKQNFLNTLYERFFQGFSRDQADTHGIVYTPQPIVDFMCESVEHVLKTEFGTSLSDKGVVILDPCTGTGNFLVNILHRLSSKTLPHKYAHELFANEVMLLPYYIASLNLEHAYYERMGQYQPFQGICFTDTLDLAEGPQLAMFSEENTERVKKEQEAQITVIIGNPPYNVGQQNENDNNKNRKYPALDTRIKETFVKDSKATLRTQVYDAYSRFFRWATDRLEDRDGVICFVTNNGFLEGFAFDGFRKHLAQDFTEVYHLDLGGNARKRGGGSVFNVMVGVGITLLVRRREGLTQPYPPAVIHHHALDDRQSGLAKLAELKKAGSVANVNWQTLAPDAKSNWITEGMQAGFADFLPLGSKDTKASLGLDAQAIFKTYSPGVMTGRDNIVYDFRETVLSSRVRQHLEDYNAEIGRWDSAGRPSEVDTFVNYNKVKWSEHLKNQLRRHHFGEFDATAIRHSLYRPFCKQFLYYNALLDDRPGSFDSIFPNKVSEKENQVILIKVGAELPLFTLMVNIIPDRQPQTGSQCFPLYTYALDGKIRRDNITDWALGQFREKYGPDVTKRDIFHYVYALLHHPDYRERYKENLKRELPRIPLAGDRPPAPFRAFVETGARLAALHVGYEQAEEYDLEWVENKDAPPGWRITKMRLTPDKTALVVNARLTLRGIPPEAFQYRLGNRSALEWVMDQYQVTTDKRSGIVSDPNRADQPDYIARLVGRVITVSVETVKAVAALPPLLPATADGAGVGKTLRETVGEMTD
jgi:predicted helicase